MTLERAVGVPAILAVIRLLSHALGMVEFRVVRGQPGGVMENATDSWQWRLLNRRPGVAPMTPFTMKADIAANYAGRGDAYLRKIKPAYRESGRPGILEFVGVDAAYVVPRRGEDGNVRYTLADGVYGNGTDLTPDDLLQVRSFSTGGPVNEFRGVSPITSARLMISAGHRRMEFEEAHLKNGIFPGMALEYPTGVTEDQAKQWVSFLEGKMRGARKAGKIAAVGGGAKLVPMPISLADALFAEMTHLTLEQAAAMWNIPPAFVMITRQQPSDSDVRLLTTFGVAPMAIAFAEALNADVDMFGPDEQDLLVVPDFTRLMTVDPLVLAQVQHQQVQSGVRVPDELRAKDGLAPLPPLAADWQKTPGMVPQITPVGGAPNPAFASGTIPAGRAAPGVTATVTAGGNESDHATGEGN